MDEQEEGSAPLKATRAHVGHINHSWDCGSIFSQELSVHWPNCPCLPTVLAPPQKALKRKDRNKKKK